MSNVNLSHDHHTVNQPVSMSPFLEQVESSEYHFPGKNFEVPEDLSNIEKSHSKEWRLDLVVTRNEVNDLERACLVLCNTERLVLGEGQLIDSSTSAVVDLLDEVTIEHGIPKLLITECSQDFFGVELKHWCCMNSVEQRFSPAVLM